ncbi:MAG: nitrite reductase [Bacteroidota bacterium]
MSGNLDLKKITDAAARDIIELKHKIAAFKNGEIDEERFKHYRLTRGVYGQRQLGVHMFRTKIPFGKLRTDQLVALANVSEKYTNGNLHLTTRQNIQMHHVKLDDSPAIWTDLANVGVTAREACGNTVRNLTASANAGIDPDELFDVSPYVQGVFEYFLRNPICQDMGRKIKPAFSSSDRDSAYTYFHDFGFIPRLEVRDGKEIRGFKVVVGGGLGAQSIVAHTAYEFLEEDQIIPFMEAAIRVFDRYGEREKRFKARMKFLVKKLGMDGFMELVETERKAIKNKAWPIDQNLVAPGEPAPYQPAPVDKPYDEDKYQTWLTTNVFEQKQKGFFAVQIRLPLGDIDAERARRFAALVKAYAADDIRITVNQGFLLRFIRPEALPHLFNELTKLELAKPGFNSIADITACPGTDTCNLAVTNSTGLAGVLEEVLQEEYPQLIESSDIKIKISGCMNACGQHMAANIGLHGSSIKKAPLIIPAMQIVMGGGVDVEGKGYVAERVIKLPTKRIPDALRSILHDYEEQATEGEYFNDYYYRLGKRYFYNLLKPLAAVDALGETDFFDWGQDSQYIQAIGVGECAGVAYDMVGTIIGDAHEKIELAKETIEAGIWADSIYHSYSAMVIGAKALLLGIDVKCNTHKGIIKDFDTNYVQEAGFAVDAESFSELVLQINQNEPSEAFARSYFAQAEAFFRKVLQTREQQLRDAGEDKQVIGKYYNA